MSARLVFETSSTPVAAESRARHFSRRDGEPDGCPRRVSADLMRIGLGEARW